MKKKISLYRLQEARHHRSEVFSSDIARNVRSPKKACGLWCKGRC